MSGRETRPSPEASQLRVRRLIQALARRIQARRLASLAPSNAPQVEAGDAPGSVTTPPAAMMKQAEQRALLGRLVDPARRQAAANERRMRGTRRPAGPSRDRG